MTQRCGGPISIFGSKTSSPDIAPKNLFGYSVVAKIGEGAANTLYKVADPAGQPFALKHVIKKTDAEERFIAQLQNEFDSTRLFRHPGLRKTIELKFPRRFFTNKVNEAALVLEWVDGEPLDQNVPTDLKQLLTMFAHCAAALSSLHRLLLVHCDFKPHNVLVTRDGKVKVIDFGQACKIGTRKSRVQGTPDFITPEQVKCVPVDERTDVYSFGASLYWCLTGQKVPTYFTVDKSNRDIIKMQKFPTPRALRKSVPEALSQFVMQCLVYTPDRRPQDMVSVLQTLEGFIKGTS
jgi:serine/threonine protein kinase